VPSIVDGLFAGRAGIQSHGTAISVLGDNIANSNTTGFKQSRADFADLLAGSLSGGGAVSAGSGSKVASTTPILTQGSFESTGRSLDVGIEGNGYLIVRDAGGTGTTFYTRAGNLQVDVDGYLLDQNGFQIQGYSTTGAGGLGPINVNQVGEQSIETTQVSIAGNLDASAATTTVPADPTTFAALNSNATFSTFLNVFDSLGAKHTVTSFFFKTAANTWTVKAYVDAGEITGGTPGNPALIGQATIAFNTQGARTTVPTPTTPDFTATPAWANGSAAASMSFIYTPMSQYASPSAINAIAQDGSGAGSVVGFSIEEDGRLKAQLDNGQTSVIGTLALATFANPEKLNRVGNSLLSESTSSGQPVIGVPSSGQFGSLKSGSLELSNSDLATDFIKLISLQRGFQGSSRIITSISDLLNEVINLAR
jgi:flagellar hook protein FlgE